MVGADCAQYSTAHAFPLPRSFSRWPRRAGNPLPTHFQASKPFHSPSQKKRIAPQIPSCFSMRPARVVARQFDRPILVGLFIYCPKAKCHLRCRCSDYDYHRENARSLTGYWIILHCPSFDIRGTLSQTALHALELPMVVITTQPKV